MRKKKEIIHSAYSNRLIVLFYLLMVTLSVSGQIVEPVQLSLPAVLFTDPIQIHQQKKR